MPPMSAPSSSAKTNSPPVDMSAEGIERRLQEVLALNRLCASLMDAGRAAGLHERTWEHDSLTPAEPPSH